MDLPTKSQETNSKKQIDTRTLRERMIEVTKKIEWMPEFGLSRELDWLKNMHDWLISKKNRYWGLALPIYVCDECKEFTVIGSQEELKEKAIRGWDKMEGKTPHKPYIDDVVIACPSCGKEARRIGDVGNPWLDAGIVPYSTIKENNVGDPLYTSNKEEWKKWFPVDFITESFPGQFKNWFYAMIAMSTVLEDTNPFKRVLGFATLLAEDGKAMHKSTGNSIEFNEGANDIGVDVMRWAYIRHNPAENLLFGYTKTNEVRRQFYLLLWNTYKYYKQYSEMDGFIYSSDAINIDNLSSVLDQWMLMRLKQTQETVKSSLESYDPRAAAEAIESLVSDTSTWYVRRSRGREDKQDFYRTISTVLVDLSVIMSPLMPFITEELYTSITGKESVHLSNWPEQKEISVNQDLIHDMETVRAIVEVGHKVRKDHQLKVRQPLASVEVKLPSTQQLIIEEKGEAYKELIAAELNVKKVAFSSEKTTDLSITYDTALTPELKKEGELRDLMRKIQQMRKKLGAEVNDEVAITIPESFKEFENQIIKQVHAKDVSYGDTLDVAVIGG
jgi:isoleucyl-tRNA synthetase